MIRKILVREYLKGYGDMTAEERETFVRRVGEWLASNGERLLALTDRPMAKSQNLVTMTARWTAEDCRALTEGVRLLSALAGVAETWLPTQIYMRSAYRAVRQMVFVLSEVARVDGQVSGFRFLRPSGSKRPEVERQVSGNGVAKEVPAGKTRKGTQAVAGNPNSNYYNGRGGAAPYNHEPKRAAGAGAVNPQALPNPGFPAAEPQGTVAVGGAKQGPQGTVVGGGANQPYVPGAQTEGGRLVPVRPRHIDQYVHLLPAGTQERAGQVKGLLTELDGARENARRLMEAGEHSDKIQAWAKRAVDIDKTVKKIYRELDAEWEKLVQQGRVVVDDLGNAHVVPGGAASGDDGQTASEPVELTSEQRQRRRGLRKLLTDVRRGNGKTRDEHLEKWRTMWAEYVTLEPVDVALKDEKIIAAIEHYGIKIEELKN